MRSKEGKKRLLRSKGGRGNRGSEGIKGVRCFSASLLHYFVGSLLRFLCLKASKSTTPVATETFRDLTGPVVGSETTKSQRLRVSSCNPFPSLPMTIPVEEV